MSTEGVKALHRIGPLCLAAPALETSADPRRAALLDTSRLAAPSGGHPGLASPLA